MTWTLASAKDRLSEVIRRAIDEGPQTISIRGQDSAVVLSTSAYELLTRPDTPRTLKDALRQMNLEDLDLERDPSPPRDFEL